MNIGGRLLLRNSTVNLLGTALPMLVAIVAIPLLVPGLGRERFGVLTIVWLAVGYFSVFDFGLSRALTKLVAERLGGSDEGEIPGITWTGLIALTGLGTLGGLLVVVAAPLLTSWLAMPSDLEKESTNAFRLIGIALPFVVSTSGLRAILEAYQRFDILNLLRVPLALATYLAPLAMLPFSSRLELIVLALAVTRVLAWIAHVVACTRCVPWFGSRVFFHAPYLRPLLTQGGWMAVSNMLSPLMVHADRVLIGSMLSMAAVTFYVTPFEVVTRLWIIPGAVMSVFFPAFATSFARDPERVRLLFEKVTSGLFVTMLPICLFVVLFAREGLELWMGPDFAIASTPVAQLFAIGVFANSIGQVPFALLQGAGRADITGKLHIAELPLYLAAFYWLTSAFGITGAAVASTLRLGVDTLALLLFTRGMVSRPMPILSILVKLFLSCCFLIGSMHVGPILLKTTLWVTVAAVAFWAGGRVLARPGGRAGSEAALTIL